MAGLAKLFGSRIKALRAERRFSQAELAERAGLSEEWVRRMERGEASPSFDTIEALAGALGASPGAFFTDRPASTPSEAIAAAADGLSADQIRWLIEGARLLRSVPSR